MPCWPLSRVANWVGRAADNAIQLAEATVSRHHALIQVDDEGSVQLIDLGTTNGTFVNGNRLAAKRPQALEDGDRVRFGSSYVLKFVRPAPCEEQFQREMFERTIRDSLTGLYNRAYFMEQVSPLARKAARQKLGLAVSDAGPGPLQADQRHVRSRRGRRCSARSGQRAAGNARVPRILSRGSAARNS